MNQKKTRQSRYVRPKTGNLKRLVLQPRDFELVKTVYNYRFIKTNQLTVIIPGDRTSIERRLRRLWEHRYLERSYMPVTPGIGQAIGHAIYSIDYKGADLMRSHEGVDPKKLKHVIRHNKPKFPDLEHQLMIFQFRSVHTLPLDRTGKA